MIEISGGRSGGALYDGPVIYMGTLSKELAPGLRVGWIAAAPEMIEALALAKMGSDMCTSGLTQRITLAAFADGLIERIQPTIVDIYRRRRDALAAALAEHLSDAFTWDVPVGGMFVWALARDLVLDTDRLFAAGLEAGVCIAPSSVFDAHGEHRRGMRLNFTFNAPERLAEGVRRIAAAVRTIR